MLEIIHELSDSNLRRIVKVIDDGGVIAFPTETVYALAADASNFDAVDRIYKLKRRFSDKPLPILVGDISQAKRIAEFDERAKKLSLLFFPGPITLVLKCKAHHNLASNINENTDTIGIRMPNNLPALKILKAVGRPLVGTSVNITNERSAINGQEVIDIFGDYIDMLIDKGEAEIGTSSTIVDLSGEQALILREGAISKRKIESILGEVII